MICTSVFNPISIYDLDFKPQMTGFLNFVFEKESGLWIQKGAAERERPAEKE